MFDMIKALFGQKPLTVIVTENRWDALGDPSSVRDNWLCWLIKKEGGISETVPPGTYHYTARVNWRGQLISDLRQAPK